MSAIAHLTIWAIVVLALCAGATLIRIIMDEDGENRFFGAVQLLAIALGIVALGVLYGTHNL